MNKIELTKGKYALVDDEDYKELDKFNWWIITGYAARTKWVNGKNELILMHRLIANTPKGLDTDHINGNRLDNRRKNLRICDTSENTRNRGIDKNNTSGYRGVSWHKRIRKWQSRITVYGKFIQGGYFSDIKEAAKKYNELSIKYHGEFGYQNKL